MQYPSGEDPSSTGPETEMTQKQLEVLQQLEQAHLLSLALKAPARRRPEFFWEGLYEQYCSPELRQEFLPYQYFSKL